MDFFQDEEYLRITSKNKKEFREIELLLLSQDILFWITYDFKIPIFVVPIAYLDKTKNEIDHYFKENENWPPVIKKQGKSSFHFSLFHFLVVFCLFYFHGQTRQNNPLYWLEKGRLSAEGVLNGEYYRLVTALTLHLDDAHLLGNLLGLLLFVSFLSQSTGWALSWFLVLLSGVVGNFLNALFYQSAHYSVGASTAVFAAVGLLSMQGAKHYYTVKYFRKKAFVPLVGALGILAMLGTNTESDVMAHVFGMISGMMIGLLMLPISSQPLPRSKIIQGCALGTMTALIWIAWQAALN